jgi:predicted phage terminase large subunit-like protein
VERGDVLKELKRLNTRQLREFIQEVGDPQIIDQINIIIQLRKQRARKKRATSALIDFIKYTKTDYETNWHHQIICDTLDEFLDPESGLDRLIIEAPPRSGKSEICTRRFPAYALGKYPDLNIIMASYAMSLAKKLNRDVQRIIDDKKYLEIFPDTRLISKELSRDEMKSTYARTSEFFEIVNRRGSLRAAGVGTGITGEGAGLLIIDDPIKDWEEAMSTAYKERLWDWYTSTAYTRLSKNGKILIIQTRWAEDDLIGKVLAKSKSEPDADKFTVISFPMEFDEDHPYIHPLDPRVDEGEILWPSFMSEKKVISTKKTVGSKVWASLYQQRPAPKEGNVVKASWFRYYRVMPKVDTITQSWDFTFTATKKSDYVVGGVWGNVGADKYLLHGVRDKLSFTQCVAEMTKVANMFRDTNKIIVEEKANGPAIIDTLRSKIAGIVGFTPTSSKESRANAVAPQIQAGNIWLPDPLSFPEHKEFVENFVKEWTTFPNASHDDCVDMTSQFLLDTNGQNAWLDKLAKEDFAEDAEYLDKIMEMMNWNKSRHTR